MLYNSPMSLGSRIKTARQVARLNQLALAKRLGVTPQAVSQWERGETIPDADRIRDIAKATTSNFYWLLDGDIRPGPEPQPRYEEPKIWRAPIVSRVAAGDWSESITPDDLPVETRYLDVYSKPEGSLFALEISGESMETEFSSGDIVIIDSGLEPLPGDFVVAKLQDDNEATFKKYRVKGKTQNGELIIELQPLNPDYPTLQISPDNPGRIVGTMVELRKFRRRK